MAHIVIAGAGIVGVSTAIWLQRAGHAVTLVDRMDGAMRTSYGQCWRFGSRSDFARAGAWIGLEIAKNAAQPR